VSAGNGRVRAALLVVVILAGASCSSSGPRSSSTSGSRPTATTTSAPRTSARVDVFGDSLVVQARDALRVEGLAHGLTVTVAAYYGLAPCDLVKPIRDDLAHPPAALVLAFSGNNITPCMAPGGRELSGSAYYAAYRRDITEIVATATTRHVAVLVVGPPRFAAAKNVPDRVALTALYRQIVARYPDARYVSAAPVVSPDGFTPTLPCVAGETAVLGCHGGRITVRAPDQVHFDAPRPVACPTGHDSCEYSAGTHRYAGVVLAGLAPIEVLHYLAAPAPVGVPIDLTKAG
jgi:hypothetical protein